MKPFEFESRIIVRQYLRNIASSTDSARTCIDIADDINIVLIPPNETRYVRGTKSRPTYLRRSFSSVVRLTPVREAQVINSVPVFKSIPNLSQRMHEQDLKYLELRATGRLTPPWRKYGRHREEQIDKLTMRVL